MLVEAVVHMKEQLGHLQQVDLVVAELAR